MMFIDKTAKLAPVRTNDLEILKIFVRHTIQAIPGNDQNASPANQKTAGSKLDRTSQLMFYGSWRHLESFTGSSLVRICLLGCLLRYLVKSLVFNGTIFE